MVTTKKTAVKAAKTGSATTRKPRAKKETLTTASELDKQVTQAESRTQQQEESDVKAGKYSYAVGRRKTSVANVRLFTGKEKSLVNKKDLTDYFAKNKFYIEQLLKPLQLTGMENRVFMYVNVSGGGLNSQAQAIAHGLALALVKHTPEFRKVLKKNGSLTRDSRMKERKKPGLKRARRGPQWAKR